MTVANRSVRHSLPEQVGGCRAEQVANSARAGFVLESTNDARWRAIQLTANESGRARQFIGDRLNAGLQFVAVRIAAPAIVAQRFHAGDADGKFGKSFAPGPAEAVGDDHRDGNGGGPFQRAAERGGGSVAMR